MHIYIDFATDVHNELVCINLFNQDRLYEREVVFNPLRFEADDRSNESDSELSEYSFDAPPYSPVTTGESVSGVSRSVSPDINDHNMEMTDMDSEFDLPDEVELVNHDAVNDLKPNTMSYSSSKWTGFKLVIDNLDKNFRHLSKEVMENRIYAYMSCI